jgi:DnaJ-class molecular chaperone
MKMRLYREQNYYELLEIAPDASPLEIRRAYKKSFDLYQDESIASYSFFSEQERLEIISLLEKAYLTLITPELRSAYDRGMIECGLMEEGIRYRDSVKEPIPIYDFKKIHLESLKPTKRAEELKLKISQHPGIQNILAQETISGSDLKKIRMELEIPLEEIAEKTNVRVEMLNAIEEENFDLFLPMVYMKGFLKSYLRYLQVDEDAALRSLVKHIADISS